MTRMADDHSPTSPYYMSGLTLSTITDGTSKTFAISEGKPIAESIYWWRGQRTWNSAYKNGTEPTLLANTLPSNGDTARYTNLGPNSDHAFKILIHGYVDGHVASVPEDISQPVFGALFTRSNGEQTGEQP